MSVSSQARAVKIDNEPLSIAKEVNRINSQLNALFDRAINFTAFMNTDPQTEFEPVDVEKYTLEFITAAAGLTETMAKLAPLSVLASATGENKETVKSDFLSSHTGTAPEEYSKQFDS